jgi:hypothetical protein
MQFELVVARYKENLDYLEKLPSSVPVTVYDKGPPCATFLTPRVNTKVEKIGNVGREPHSYTRYILDRYDTLPEVVVFTQGNPRDHTGTRTDLEIISWIFTIVEQAKQSGLSTQGVEAHKAGCNSATSDFRIVYPDLEQYEGKDLGTWYQECTDRKFPDTGALWSMGACFAASRDNIRKVPKETWSKLYESFSYSSAPVTAHYMERAWHTLLK